MKEELTIRLHWPYPDNEFDQNKDSIDVYVGYGGEEHVGTFISPKALGYQLEKLEGDYLLGGKEIITNRFEKEDIKAIVSDIIYKKEFSNYFIVADRNS